MTRPPNCAEALKLALDAMNAMLTHMGMDVDKWNKVTFDQMRQAVTAAQKALAQPEQVREAYASITIRVGNRYIQQFVTQEMFLSAKEPWWLLDQYAKRCVEKLKESA